MTAGIPLLVLIPVVAMLVWSAGQAAYNKILISKVRSDLVLAEKEFVDLQDTKLLALKAWADSAYVRNVLQKNAGKLDDADLDGLRKQQEFSYVRFIALNGEVSASSPSQAVYTVDPITLKEIRRRDSSRQVVLMSEDEMHRISPELAKLAAQPVVDTPNARPSDKTVEHRGLVLQFHHPQYMDGRLTGYIEAGILVNKNLSMVDNLNNLIYSPDTLLEGSFGTATIFLEDVRVATTVRRSDQTRALGTRVSEEVRETVLGRGQVWLERAFVVNDWYLAAYAPLVSPDGSRIGMLYVGFLEAPYAAIRKQLAVLFFLAVLSAMGVGSVMVARLVSGIFYPLRRMNYIMSRQEQGDTQARVGDLKRADEFADLAEHFDALLDQLEQRRRELEILNADLDARVNERTADLHAANQKLHQAVEQLLAAEKLAVMGQLTAGIAHEFNNPLAIMMGHLDLLRMSATPQDTQKTLRMLDEQIQRMRQIVQKLLQFCRPDEFASYTASLDVREVIQDSLLFAKSELSNAGAQVNLDFQASRWVQISKTELQQIMVNLLINAAHAVETVNVESADVGERIIDIQTRDHDWGDGSEGIVVSVSNNGQAIEPERLPLIFQMFYTTKLAGRGSGIGLPVSRMLVQRYGGDLLATSPAWPADAPHCGARFDVLIRCHARPTADILKESGQQRALLIERQFY
ncbi:cache domain-containing protein [Limnobacter humi]|uniref:histidine kinase n=1 Tax=Limnobacter humi TaxID=1778671 RepID=A0ABT1WHZ6_9BURK|nr:cache domain-containing protein [Limnobacter humi]